jgi:pyrroline-5-carboxylate reductase
MVVSTLFGTSKVMMEKGIGFSEMIRRVATKGGITEEDVNVLNHHLPSTFDEVFQKTLTKHAHVPDGHLKIPHPWPGQNPPPSGGQSGV